MSDADTRVHFASTAMATGTGLQKTPHQTFNEWLEGILSMSVVELVAMTLAAAPLSRSKKMSK